MSYPNWLRDIDCATGLKFDMLQKKCEPSCTFTVHKFKSYFKTLQPNIWVCYHCIRTNSSWLTLKIQGFYIRVLLYLDILFHTSQGYL